MSKTRILYTYSQSQMGGRGRIAKKKRRSHFKKSYRPMDCPTLQGVEFHVDEKCQNTNSLPIHNNIIISGDLSIFSRVHATLQPTLSVCLSVGRLVTLSFFRVYWQFGGYCSCPTAWLVYFTISLPLPTRTRLGLPCIRPCSFIYHLLSFVTFFIHQYDGLYSCFLCRVYWATCYLTLIN